MHTQTQPAEFLTAMRSIKAAKNVFLLLALLGLLVQIAAFVAVRWGGVIDDSQTVTGLHGEPAARKASTPENDPAVPDEASEPQPAATTAPASAPRPAEPATPDGDEMAEVWVVMLTWVLPGSKFMTLAATAILAAILMFATMLAINARESGVAGIVSAALWSLLLLAMVTPWQQALNSSIACGATYNFGELIKASRDMIPRWGAPKPDTLETILYYARFLAYPGLAVLVWLVVQVKFARGFGRMMRVALGEEDASPTPMTLND